MPMKKLLPLFAIAFLALTLLPFAANAARLIPCGESGNPCTLCHVFVLGGNIKNFFLLPPPLGAGIVPIVATVLIVIGGFLLITAGGDPTRLKKASAVLTAVVVGLIIIYASGLLLNTLFIAIGGNPDFSVTDFSLKSLTNTASWCPVKP
jgi:hypothetical protein